MIGSPAESALNAAKAYGRRRALASVDQKQTNDAEVKLR